MFPVVSWKMDGVTQEQDWVRLGEKIVATRVALGMHTRDQLATVAGFSTRLLADIEKARRNNYDRSYLARLELALGWSPGSVAAILAGGEPTRTSVGAGTADSLGDEDFADLELEVQMILRWKLPESVKQDLITEAWRLREQQLVEQRKLRDQQATERRNLVRTWIDRARGGGAPAADTH